MLVSFQIDHPDSLNYSTDSTLPIILESQKRGFKNYVFQPHNVFMNNKGIFAYANQIKFKSQSLNSFIISNEKILNLNNYVIEGSIKVEGKPESIVVDGTDLWVAIQMNNDYSDGNKLLKISTVSNSISETHEIGKGPTSLTVSNNNVYVANTYYDANYNAFYGSSKLNVISKEIDINYYGSGVVCGGDVLNYNNDIFRSFSGGAAKLGSDLKILEQTKIGSYDPAQLYSSEIIGDYIYFGITDYSGTNQVKVVDFNNNEVASYDVGLFPGDFAFWSSN